jgi:hypothetical protein
MSKVVFILQPQPHPSRRNCWEAIKNAPDGVIVEIREPTRTDKQNDMIQPMLREFAKKAPPIPVNGEPVSLDMDDWRHILVARYRRETARYALYGGTLIMLGASSKKLTVKQGLEFVEFLHAEAARMEFTLTMIEPDPR